MKQANKLISIIVPVYNTEKYLTRCLQSLCGQTYQEIEVIVVDDGSTDGSAHIVKEFAEKDARVKYYYKENGGAISAVSYGVNLAEGDYIAFVDSDDYVDGDFIFNFVTNIGDADVLAMGIIYQEEHTAREYPLLYDTTYVDDGLRALQNDFVYDHSFGMSQRIFVARWNKLYRAELVKKIIGLYEELNLSDNEDSYFTFLVIREAASIKTLLCVNGYHYCVNPASVTHRLKSYDGFVNYVDKLENAGKTVGERLGIECTIHESLIVFGAWDYLCDFVKNLPKKQAKREMKAVLKNNRYRAALKTFRYSRMDFHGKIKLFLFRRRLCGMLYYFIKKKQG